MLLLNHYEEGLINSRKARILAGLRKNPKNVRFNELCKAAEIFGFKYKGGKGSHRIFVKEGILRLLKNIIWRSKMALKYAVEIFRSKEDRGYVAIAPKLPGCSAFGVTEEEALKEIKVAIELWLETAKKENREIPDPQDKPVLTGFSKKVRSSFSA